IAAGEDIIHARYEAPPGNGVEGAVQVRYDSVPMAGDMRVYGRVLDHSGRPLGQIPLTLSAGAGQVEAHTGADGWAAASVPMPSGFEPLVVEASTANRLVRDVAIRGGQGLGGPGTPDLKDQVALSIRPGNVENIELTVEPAILYAGQRATAFVSVVLRDRSGLPVVSEAVELEASEGTLDEPIQQDDGSYVAEYSPESGDRSRDVTITAKVKSSGRSATTRLEVVASPINGAIGLVLGGITNFGQVNPAVGLHLDLRTAWVGRTMMFRLGVGQHWNMSEIDADLGDPARVRLIIYPIEVGVMLRRDHRGRGIWLGVMGVVAPYWSQMRIGDDVVGSGVGALPGISFVGGVGFRVAVGEFVFELKGLALPGPRGDLSYRGTVGGLAAGLGYRIVY
ncbi:MAG: hypothetical protein HN348_10035, partial [Proteobacteria bacterium]|nr:hypothetical protein [Pseudomonadota bacterium]